VLVETLIAFFARKGYELLAACVIDFDVDEAVLTALFSRVAGKKAACEAVRKWSNMSHATAESKARARIVHTALGVTPRPVSTLRFTPGPGTGGGPLLLAAMESLSSRGGVDNDDYEAACADPRTAGVRRTFVSINHTGCVYSRLPEGVLFVMEGRSDAFSDAKGWKRIAQYHPSLGQARRLRRHRAQGKDAREEGHHASCRPIPRRRASSREAVPLDGASDSSLTSGATTRRPSRASG
jgi:hypothetical protein